jgi:UDP-glucose 4-epimerase
LKTIVTGSSGFVGKRLVERLRAAGHEVISLDIAEGIDLTRREQLAGIPGFDCAFHLAARTFVPDSFKNPFDFYFSNVVSTLNMLELCRRHKARFVYTSSYVYGPPQYLPVDEKHPVAAHNPYAQTKLIGEDLCHAYWRDFSVSACILRPFNIYGPDQKGDFLIPSIIKQARQGRIILKDPRPRRDFIYVDDVVNAYLACMERGGTGVEVFNVGSGRSVTVAEVVRIVAKHFPSVEAVFTGEERPNEVLDTVADITKARNLLNWKLGFSFEQGIQQCLQTMDSGSSQR